MKQNFVLRQLTLLLLRGNFTLSMPKEFLFILRTVVLASTENDCFELKHASE